MLCIHIFQRNWMLNENEKIIKKKYEIFLITCIHHKHFLIRQGTFALYFFFLKKLSKKKRENETKHKQKKISILYEVYKEAAEKKYTQPSFCWNLLIDVDSLWPLLGPDVCYSGIFCAIAAKRNFNHKKKIILRVFGVQIVYVRIPVKKN